MLITNKIIRTAYEKKILRMDKITLHQYVDFFVGRDTDFDAIAISTLPIDIDDCKNGSYCPIPAIQFIVTKKDQHGRIRELYLSYYLQEFVDWIIARNGDFELKETSDQYLFTVIHEQ